MNSDLSKYEGLTIPQQQARRRIEYVVTSCKGKRASFKRMGLDAGTEYKANEQRLIESEAALAEFDRRISEPQINADKADKKKKAGSKQKR